MKKTLLFLMITLITANFIAAQSSSNDFKIIWGEVQKTKRSVSLDDFFGYDESGLYAIKSGYKGFMIYKPVTYLEHYNASLKRTHFIELKLENNGKSMYFDKVIYSDDEIYLFAKFINKKLDKIFLFVQKVNKKTLMPSGQLTKVAETEYKGLLGGNFGEFFYTFSRDTTKLLIYNTLPVEKGKPQQFGLTVFDQSINKLWDKKISLPYDDELFDVQDYTVDNDGNVHIVSVLYNEKRKEKRKGKPNYSYQIFSIYNQGKEIKEYSIALEGKFITDMRMSVNNQKEIVCAGFYSNKSSFNLEGTYNVKVDPQTKEITSKHMNEFGVDYLDEDVSEDEENNKSKKPKDNKKEKEMYNYKLHEILFSEDGNSYLVAEQYYVVQYTTTTSDGKGGFRTTTSFHYYYNDIIVVRMSNDGKIVWVTKIPKSQSSANDGGFYSSYVLAIINGKINFFFNDHADNINIVENQKPKPLQTQRTNSIMVRVELNDNGKQTKHGMFNTKDVSMIICPKVCKQISKDKLMIYGKKGTKENIAVITFE